MLWKATECCEWCYCLWDVSPQTPQSYVKNVCQTAARDRMSFMMKTGFRRKRPASADSGAVHYDLCCLFFWFIHNLVETPFPSAINEVIFPSVLLEYYDPARREDSEIRLLFQVCLNGWLKRIKLVTKSRSSFRLKVNAHHLQNDWQCSKSVKSVTKPEKAVYTFLYELSCDIYTKPKFFV